MLTVTGATFSGANATEFSTDATFPFNVDTEDSVDIEITFTPGEAVGLFAADLVLASNDENDPAVTLGLSANVEPPFEGLELIVNGDFETGDLAGWREQARFGFTDTPTRAGDGAAVYTLVAGQKWGEARLETTPPLGLEGEPLVLTITPEMIGKDYEYSAWYYRPSEGGMNPTDEVMTIFRWNKINVGNSTHARYAVGNLPEDTWFRVVGNGTIPDVGGDGLPTTSVEPIWSFHDVEPDNPGGQLMYIDDVSFKVDVPVVLPDPVTEFTNIEVDTANDVIRITWTSVAGGIYAVDRSTVLTSDGWLAGELDDGVEATGETHTYEDFGAVSEGAEELFYRVRLIDQP